MPALDADAASAWINSLLAIVADEAVDVVRRAELLSLAIQAGDSTYWHSCASDVMRLIESHLADVGAAVQSQSQDGQLAIFQHMHRASSQGSALWGHTAGAHALLSAAATIALQPPEIVGLVPELRSAALTVVGSWSDRTWIDTHVSLAADIELTVAEHAFLEPAVASAFFMRWLALGVPCSHGRQRYFSRITPAICGIADADHQARIAAVVVALQCGWSDARLVPLLLERLASDEADLSLVAAGIVAARSHMTEHESATAVHSLVALISDEHRSDRVACLEALSTFGAAPEKMPG